MPRVYTKRYDDALRREIGEAVMRARPITGSQRDPRNTPWRDLEESLGYGKQTLWKLWREAKSRARRR